ncbi:hypothetical protein SAMN04487831_11073 [Pseudobutyrivibrio sp. UC1225]|uniref:hypothetical protein n=1 Tax=Pseudobutyrivibrio sp. UC1225 TaxID=1798185 RepID=UPI0008DED3B6|nr:hypothetical protein [Pseudobutyrivibrio sp. UC1225]SFO17133.1 hypothetical protein SAMN04487831_11073 [Pseudobutyrivibrio sp. UC1225]
MRKKMYLSLMSFMALGLIGCGAKEAAVDTENVEVAEEETVQMNGLLDPDTAYVFGTATLSYAEFYSGDVSSVDSYDAVASATTGKSEIFPNMVTDFVDETTNADGYHITGVKNVNVAVPADQVDAYKAINDSFVEADAEPEQYKVVTVEDGKATYSETNFAVADTVTDADAQLLTGTVWGDYEIDILETSTSYIKNTREDGDFKIDGNIQGIILETESGLKVGMEYLQSVWVQPYEISFNVASDNTHNQRMTFDNLDELSKLEKETVTKVTFINQNDAYVYELDGVYVKPVYKDAKATAVVDEKAETITLSDVPADLENPTVTATYVVGEGREAIRTEVCSAAVADSVQMDSAALKEAKAAGEGSYTIVISSDNYANIAVVTE